VGVYVQGLPKFFEYLPPIISGTGTATNFKFCTHILSIDRNKSPLQISGKVVGCVVKTLKTFQCTHILRASCGLLCDSSAVLFSNLYSHGDYQTENSWQAVDSLSMTDPRSYVPEIHRYANVQFEMVRHILIQRRRQNLRPRGARTDCSGAPKYGSGARACGVQGQRQSPWSEGLGAKPPETESFFAFRRLIVQYFAALQCS